MMNRTQRLWCACLAMLLANAGASSAQTNPYTWNLATSGNWNSAASWLNGSNVAEIPPSGAATDLVFGGSTTYTATNDIGAFTLNSLTVSNTGVTTIAGGTGLTFGGVTSAITVAASSGATTISGPITYSTATSVSNASSALLTISGAQTIGADLTFFGSGAKTISGGMNYTGPRILTNNGAGLVTLSGAQTLTGAQTFTGSGNFTISGAIGAGTLNYTGTGLLILSSTSNAFTTLNISSGTVQFGDTRTAGAAGSTINLSGTTATLNFNSNFTATSATAGTSQNHAFAFAANSNITWNVAIGITVASLGSNLTGANTTTLTKTGAGLLSFQTGATTFAGKFVINAGNVRTTSNALTALTGVTVNSGGQYIILDDAAAPTFNIASGATITLNGVGPAGSATPGAFINTDQSPTGANTTLPSPTWPNAVILATDSTVGVYAGTANGGRYNRLTFSNTVTGAGNLTKAGPGLLTLSNANNTYGGSTSTTTVLNGGIRIGVANGLPTATALTLGDAAANTSGVFDLNGFNQTVRALASAGTGAANTVANLGAGTPTFTVNQATNTTYAGRLGGSVSFNGSAAVAGNSFNFVKSGAGTLALSGTNSYTGTTTVNAGTLAITTANSLPSTTAAITVAAGGVIDVSAISGGYTVAAGRTLTAGRPTSPANDIVGALNLAGVLNAGGTGTAATTTVSGDLTLNAGTLALDLSNNPSAGNDLIAVGGSLIANGVSTLQLTQSGLSTGNYTLLTYAGTLTGDASNFALAGIATAGRQTLTIDTTTTAGAVLLNVVGAPATLTWVGNSSNNAWDLATTANFVGATGTSPDNRFYDDDVVTFNGTGVGGGGNPVIVNSTLRPFSMTVTGSQDYTFTGTGALAAPSTLTKSGSGVLTFSIPVSFGGGTTVDAGTLTIGNGGSITGAVTLVGGILNVGVANAVTGTVTVTGSATATGVAGGIAGPVVVAPGGTLISTVDGLISSNVTVNGTGVFQVGDGGTSGSPTGSIALTAGGTLAFNRSDAGGVAFASAVSGTGSLRNDGSATITLSTAIAAGNLSFTGAGNIVMTGNVSGASSLTQSGGGAVVVSGNISGATTITQSGSGSLTLTGTNTQTGAISITGGTLSAGSNANLGGALTVSLNGGTLRATGSMAAGGQTIAVGTNGGTLQVDPGFTVAKTGGLVTGAGNTLTITGGGTLSIESSGSTNISNVVVANGIYRLTSVRYLAANTTAYTVTVQAGGTLFNFDTTSFTGTGYFPFGATTGAFTNTITLNGDGYVGGSGATNATPMFGAYLHALAEDSSTATNSATSVILAPITLASTSRFTLAVGANGNRTVTDRIVDTISGGISGPGGLILDGDGKGTLVIGTVAATYQGSTRVAAGTLRLGLNDALPVGSALVLGGTTGDNTPDSSGVLDLFGKSQTVAGLSTVGGGTNNAVLTSAAGNPTFTVNVASGTQTYAGALGGGGTNNNTFNFVKSGAGTQVLSGSSTYTGTTTINGGTLAITSATALPSTTAPITIASGGVLDVSAAGGYTVGAGRTLTMGRASTPANDFVGDLTLAGTLNPGGTGSAAVATISGSFTLSSATLAFDLGTSVSSGNDLISVGGNLLASGISTFQINQNGLADGTYTLITYGGTFSGDTSNFAVAGITANGGRRTAVFDTTTTPGAVLLNVSGSPATLTWVGNASNNVWDAVTTANFTGATGASPDNRFFNGDTVTFDGTGLGGVANPVTLTGTLEPASLTVTGAQDYTFTGTGSIAGAGPVTKSGTGTLNLTVLVATSGTTTVSDGVLTISTGGAISGPVNLTGGTLNASTASSVTGALTADGGILNASVTGAVSGPLVVNSGATAVATADNAFTGATTAVNGTGVLQFGDGGAAGSASGAVSLNSGGMLVFKRSDDFSVSNVLSGAGNIVQNGAGRVTLLASNPFTGTITINSGTLRIQDAGAGGDINAVSIVVNGGAKFEFFGPAGNPDLPNSTYITINSNGVAEFTEDEVFGGIKLYGGNLAVNLTNADIGLSGSAETEFRAGTVTTSASGRINGSAAIRKTTAGTVTIAGVPLNNTGGLFIDAGTLSTNAAIIGTGTLSFGTNGSGATTGTLLYTGTSTTLNKSTTLNADGGVVDVSLATTTFGFAGAVTGPGGLTKAGAGTLALSGTGNTYSGGTTVTAGVLAVNNASGSATGTGAVTVNGGVLRGGDATGLTGFVSGPVTVNTGGTIRGGDGVIGTLNLQGGLTLNAGGILEAQVATTGVNTAIASLIDLSGGSSVLNLNYDTGTIIVNLVNDTVAPLNPSEAYTFTLAQVSANGNIQVNGVSQVADGVNAIPIANYQLTTSNFVSIGTTTLFIDASGTRLQMTIGAVPEPAHLLLLGTVAIIAWTSARRYLSLRTRPQA